MKRLTRKRLSWLGALAGFPFNAWLGDRHYDRYGGHPWRADAADRENVTRTGQLELTLALDSAEARAERWVAAARQWLEFDLDSGAGFTADDVRSYVGDPPGHGDAMGAVFRSAARAGLITCTGTTTSKRPDAHGRLLREWRRL